MSRYSEGQVNVLVLADQAKEALYEAITRGDTAAEAQAQKAWVAALEALRLATRLTEVLHDVPEATSKPEAETLRREAVDQTAVQAALLVELGEVKREDIASWYGENRKRLEQVQRPELRNPLFDAIRRRARGDEA